MRMSNSIIYIFMSWPLCFPVRGWQSCLIVSICVKLKRKLIIGTCQSFIFIIISVYDLKLYVQERNIWNMPLWIRTNITVSRHRSFSWRIHSTDYIRKGDHLRRSHHNPWVNAFHPILKKRAGGRLNKKDGLTRYGDSHVKDKTS